jgi:hypothetical protein
MLEFIVILKAFSVGQGSWVWTDGSAWDYTDWNPVPDGEPPIPDGGTYENCAEFNWNGLWYDDLCQYQRLSICKI